MTELLATEEKSTAFRTVPEKKPCPLSYDTKIPSKTPDLLAYLNIGLGFFLAILHPLKVSLIGCKPTQLPLIRALEDSRKS